MVAAEGTCTGNPTDEGGFAKFCNYITQGLIYYTPDEITLINNDYDQPTSIPTVTTETIITEIYLDCNATFSGATMTHADPQDAVVLYALEQGNGHQENECLPSETIVTNT
jgi:hypothetical protein